MAVTQSNQNLPNKDDRLIGGVPEYSHVNACIGKQLEDDSAFDWYCDGFRKAAARLGADMIAEGNTVSLPVDVAVYPLVFLYRHYLELRFKILIAVTKELSGEPADLPKGHKLDVLWEEARPRLENMFPKQDWSPNEHVSRLIKELCSVDPVGQAGRYPVDNKGNKHFANHTLLNIKQFVDVVEKLCDYLDCISYQLEDAQEHMREWFGQALRDSQMWE